MWSVEIRGVVSRRESGNDSVNDSANDLMNDPASDPASDSASDPANCRGNDQLGEIRPDRLKISRRHQ